MYLFYLIDISRLMKVKFSPGASRLQVVKVLKEELHLHLKDAKEMMESGEFECYDTEYPHLKKKLEEVGAGEFYRAD
jgi:ribosomal protein L7/L12